MRTCTARLLDAQVDAYAAADDAIRDGGGIFLDTDGWFCFERQCPAVVGHRVTHRVSDHMTHSYGETLGDLFREEFRLHLLGGPYHFPAPAAVAFAAGSAEIVLPILLALGLATRAAALGLLVMTLVVQLTVPDGWPVHVTWAAMALAIMAWGPGRISLDHGIDRIIGHNTPRTADGSPR